MLIKTLRHKKDSIHDLMWYMVLGMEDNKKDVYIAYNLPSLDIEDNIEAFLKNDLYRQQTQATTQWYHEILSFSPLDSE